MIESALDRFSDALQARTGPQFETMAQTVQDLNRSLKDSADGLADTQREIRTALGTLLETVKTLMNSSTTAMTETLHRSLDEMTRNIGGASEELAARLVTSSAAAKENMKGTLDSVTRELADTGVQAATRITAR